ncbi:MAG TPA: RluA family pseudouridine synthase [Candidatus Dormibacteraeota bacterium]|nr:RluA family pseudouridine synthase [Candidatus Dormibacteraeota bacterium]
MPDASRPEAGTELSAALPAEAGLRLDVFLSGRLGGTRAHLQRLVREGLVSVGGRTVLRPSQVIRLGDLAKLAQDLAPAPAELPQQLARRVYEDELVVVVDKPAGMVVHPGPGHREGTLAQLVQSWGGPWSIASGEDRAGIVHRLDRGTSGLLVLARTEEAHRALARQLRARTMGREYWALAEGEFREDRGRIEAAIGRDPKRPRRMAVSPGGREAATEFSVLERWPLHTALRLRLLTGRTHQIRVHLAYIGRPVAGDGLYGASFAKGSVRPALHAAMLHFRHPHDGRQMAFVSPLPDDLEALRLQVGAPAESRAVWPWEALTSTVA